MTILDLKVYFEYCWKEHIRFKEIKDKIVFFIGTLFITVLFGTGLLIYQSYAHILPTQSEIIEYRMILDKLYTLQYIMMHLFFLLLYLYFTYNNVLEKIFLIEAQCAEIKLLEMQGIVGDLIKPISFIRKRYAVEKIKNLFVNVRWVKDFGNFILMVIYFLFSLIPLSFNKNFNLFNLSSEFYMKIYWIPIGFGALIFLLILILISKYFIINVKNEITVNWGLANHDLFK